MLSYRQHTDPAVFFSDPPMPASSYPHTTSGATSTRIHLLYNSPRAIFRLRQKPGPKATSLCIYKLWDFQSHRVYK